MLHSLCPKSYQRLLKVATALLKFVNAFAIKGNDLLLISLKIFQQQLSEKPKTEMLKIFLVILMTAAVLPIISSTPVEKDLIKKHPFMRPLANEDNGRIVGGQPVDIANLPYQGYLLSRQFHICGCVLIHQKFALTAAHCVDGAVASNLIVGTGSNRTTGGYEHQVDLIIQHRDYSPRTLDFDFALLRVISGFRLELRSVGLIELPSQFYKFEVGTECTVSGWGNTLNSNESREFLRAVCVPKFDIEQCRIAYEPFGMNVTERMLCAGFPEGGRDACQGKT